MDFRIRQKHNRQGTSRPTKLNTAKLCTTSHGDSFEQEMDSALAQWEEKEISTPDEEWAPLQQVVYNTAKTYFGKPDRKQQDWFDTNDQELQTRMSKRGCPEKFTTMIQALHTEIMVNVSVGGNSQNRFSVTKWVKEVCVLAPTLFSIFLSAMLD